MCWACTPTCLPRMVTTRSRTRAAKAIANRVRAEAKTATWSAAAPEEARPAFGRTLPVASTRGPASVRAMRQTLGGRAPCSRCARSPSTNAPRRGAASLERSAALRRTRPTRAACPSAAPPCMHTRIGRAPIATAGALPSWPRWERRPSSLLRAMLRAMLRALVQWPPSTLWSVGVLPPHGASRAGSESHYSSPCSGSSPAACSMRRA